jgi:hypothetical protein
VRGDTEREREKTSIKGMGCCVLRGHGLMDGCMYVDVDVDVLCLDRRSPPHKTVVMMMMMMMMMMIMIMIY